LPLCAVCWGSPPAVTTRGGSGESRPEPNGMPNSLRSSCRFTGPAAGPMGHRGSTLNSPWATASVVPKSVWPGSFRQAGLTGVHRRKRHGCTRRDPARPSYPDLVKRDFTVTALKSAVGRRHNPACHRRRLALLRHCDRRIESEKMVNGKCGAFSRKVVGWSMGERPVADLVVGAVNMAT
jgi:transposase InsO family protein